MKMYNPFDDARNAILNHIHTVKNNAECFGDYINVLEDYVRYFNGKPMTGPHSIYRSKYNDNDIIVIVEVDDPTDTRVINTKGIMQKSNYGDTIIYQEDNLVIFLIEKGIFSSGKTGRISRTIQAIIGCYASKVLPNTDIRPYTVGATLVTLTSILDDITTDESVYKNCAPTEVSDCYYNFLVYEKIYGECFKMEHSMGAYLHIYNAVRYGRSADDVWNMVKE